MLVFNATMLHLPFWNRVSMQENPRILLLKTPLLQANGVVDSTFKTIAALARELSERSGSHYFDKPITVRNLLGLSFKPIADRHSRPLPIKLKRELLELVKDKLGEHNYKESNFEMRFNKALGDLRDRDSHFNDENIGVFHKKIAEIYESSTHILFSAVYPNFYYKIDPKHLYSIYHIIKDAAVHQKTFRFYVSNSIYAIEMWRLLKNVVEEMMQLVETEPELLSFDLNIINDKDFITLKNLVLRPDCLSSLNIERIKVLVSPESHTYFPIIMLNYQDFPRTTGISQSSDPKWPSCILDKETVHSWFRNTYPVLSNPSEIKAISYSDFLHRHI